MPSGSFTTGTNSAAGLEFRLGLFDDSDVRPKLRMRLELRLGLFGESDILHREITTRAKPPYHICLYDTHWHDMFAFDEEKLVVLCGLSNGV